MELKENGIGIRDVLKRRDGLCDEIYRLLGEFERETLCIVREISIERRDICIDEQECMILAGISVDVRLSD